MHKLLLLFLLLSSILAVGCQPIIDTDIELCVDFCRDEIHKDDIQLECLRECRTKWHDCEQEYTHLTD